MKKNLFRVLIVTITILIVVAIAYLPLFPFKTVYHDGSSDHNLIEKIPDKEIINSISKTLDKYGERYWIFGTKLLVPLSLFFDKQLRWNYITKS